MNKIYNNLTVENLMKTKQFKQLDRDKKEEMLINSDWFNQFNYYQQEEIKIGIKENLDLSIYANPKFDWEQMDEIREGLKSNIDVLIYAKTEYNCNQMQQIRLGLKEDLDVSIYANPDFGWSEMYAIRERLSKESKIKNE